MNTLARRAALAAILVVPLAGCITQQMLREGERLEREGQFLAAALRYLDVLDRDAKNEQAQNGLKKIGPDAYSQGLAVATSAESAQRYPAAADGYQALSGFIDRMKRRGLLSFEVIDANAKAIEMADKAAAQLYASGGQAMAQKHWTEAIAAYKEAQRFKPGYQDTDQKIAEALYNRAEEQLAGRQWRAAAQDFADSARSAGGTYKDAIRRGGGIYVALARYFQSQGRCRQAAAELGGAASLLGADAVRADLDAALACARTPVAVLPLENRTNRLIEGLSPGDAITNALSQQIAERGSRFVPLVPNSVLQAVMQARQSGVDARVPDVRFIVSGQLSQVRSRMPRDRSSEQAAGRVTIPCPPPTAPPTAPPPGADPSAPPPMSTCARDVIVDYELHVQRVEAGLAGTLVAVDAPSGQPLLTWPFDRSDSDEVRWAANPSVGGQPVALAPPVGPDEASPIGVVHVDQGLIDLVKARRDPRPVGAMMKGLVAAIATEAAGQVLGAVDVEPPGSDPSALVLDP